MTIATETTASATIVSLQGQINSANATASSTKDERLANSGNMLQISAPPISDTNRQPLRVVNAPASGIASMEPRPKHNSNIPS